MPAGASQVRVGGREVEVTVAPNRRNNPDGLVVSGGDFTMRIAGLNSTGESLPLADDGALILQQRNLARTEGTGFQANGPVQVYIMSTPRFLGTVMSNADGTFTGKVRSVSVGVLPRWSSGTSRVRPSRTTISNSAPNAPALSQRTCGARV